MHADLPLSAEAARLRAADQKSTNWRQWGPYLSERQWGTVREDYSADGDAWEYFPHDQARSRAYRWGEDGLAGICDEHCRLCLALALWNGRDPILKERLFGLTNHEGNHGEDVKERYYYLDATPTHSYSEDALQVSAARVSLRPRWSRRTAAAVGREPEFELLDTGVFDDDRYFDVFVEYAKAAPDDILMLVTVHNRGPRGRIAARAAAALVSQHLVVARPGRHKPSLEAESHQLVIARHQRLGEYRWHVEAAQELIFCENETNTRRLFGSETDGYFKDAFHDYLIGGQQAP